MRIFYKNIAYLASLISLFTIINTLYEGGGGNSEKVKFKDIIDSLKQELININPPHKGNNEEGALGGGENEEEEDEDEVLFSSKSSPEDEDEKLFSSEPISTRRFQPPPRRTRPEAVGSALGSPAPEDKEEDEVALGSSNDVSKIINELIKYFEDSVQRRGTREGGIRRLLELASYAFTDNVSSDEFSNEEIISDLAARIKALQVEKENVIVFLKALTTGIKNEVEGENDSEKKSPLTTSLYKENLARLNPGPKSSKSHWDIAKEYIGDFDNVNADGFMGASNMKGGGNPEKEMIKEDKVKTLEIVKLVKELINLLDNMFQGRNIEQKYKELYQYNKSELLNMLYKGKFTKKFNSLRMKLSMGGGRKKRTKRPKKLKKTKKLKKSKKSKKPKITNRHKKSKRSNRHKKSKRSNKPKRTKRKLR